MNLKFELAKVAAAAFLVAGPIGLRAQSIDSFTPAYGQIGDTVYINGSAFSTVPGGVTVKFNGVQASIFVSSSLLIRATVPNTTSGLISVQNAGAPQPTYSSQPFTVIGAGPYISDFTPTNGTGGTRVYLNGAHFGTGITGVWFNATQTFTNFVVGDTYMWADAPAGVTTGPITVSGPAGSSTSAQLFYVPPVVTGIAPASGRANTNVIISGANFIGTTAVTFNGKASPTFTVNSSTQLVAAVPASATTGTLIVTTPFGSYPAPTAFTVLPTIYGFSPGSGLVGASVTITGANLNVGTPVVRFNGTQATLSGTPMFGQVTALVPSGATTGPISVTTTDGSDTNANNFLLPASITSFTPTNAAAGAWIRVNGQNFLGVTNLSFNGQSASFVITNNTVIGAMVPGGVITGPLSVTTPINSTNSTGLFYGAPLITGFNPTHATVGSSVTITGTNFLGVSAVRFNSVNGGITSSNNGQIVVTVLAGAQSGPITVVTPGGTNASAGTFVVDSPSDLAISSTVAPNPATLGSNLVYAITILNNGPNSAPNVKLTNTLPDFVTLKTATISQGTVATGNPIIGTVGTMNNGTAVTLTLTVVPNAVGIITDTMSVGSDALDPVPGNNNASTNVLVQSPVVLSIQALNNPANQIQVSWPVDLTNYALQARNSLLTNTFWSNVTATATVSGSQRLVTEGNTNATRFYRLKR